MSNELRDWYDSIPFFTRWWLTLTVGLSLAARFDLVHPYNLYLLFDQTFYGFQIWRPLTALFYGRLSFNFLISCYFIYNYSKMLETGAFGGKPADFCYLLLFNWVCCVLVGLLFGMRLIMDPMVLSVMYVWCQLNKDVIVSFWFGTRFKAMYLPWVLAGFQVILGAPVLEEFSGIVVGHLAFFLMFIYPQEFGGASWLTPPTFLKRLFPATRQMGGFGSAPQNFHTAPDPAMFRGHDWGQGYRLGGN